jgi:hypothetical protein
MMKMTMISPLVKATPKMGPRKGQHLVLLLLLPLFHHLQPNQITKNQLISQLHIAGLFQVLHHPLFSLRKKMNLLHHQSPPLPFAKLLPNLPRNYQRNRPNPFNKNHQNPFKGKVNPHHLFVLQGFLLQSVPEKSPNLEVHLVVLNVRHSTGRITNRPTIKFSFNKIPNPTIPLANLELH